ncbi:MAG: oligosaccharide flippase family protein [Sedimentisphaerales bacterium]|nr:oligosaccharide flippase family protein [Sedimentisphaerales bacterium]
MSLIKRLTGDGLFGRCVRACGWLGVGTAGTQVIRMVRLGILTYLLAPDDFGILGLAWCVVALMEEFSDTGVKHALIQNPRGSEKAYQDGAWWVNFIRHALMTVVLFITARPIAEGIYHKPEITRLLHLSCIIMFVNGLSSVGLVLLRRELRFGRIALVTIVSNGMGLLGAVVVTWLVRTAEGVVWGEIVVSITTCVLSYMIHPYRPGWRQHRQALKEMISFGAVVYIVSLITCLSERLDILLLRRITGDYDTGLYALAMTIILAPLGLFSMLSISIGVPALSSLQHDRAALRQGLGKIVAGGLLISIPVFALIALLAGDIVKVLPEKYADIAGPLGWLCFFGWANSLARKLSPALYAINRVYWCGIFGMVRVVIVAVLIGPMYKRWGLAGACWATNLAIAAGDVWFWWILIRELCWPMRELGAQLAMVGRSVLGGLMGGFCVWGIFMLVGNIWGDSLWMRLSICVAGLASYMWAGWAHYQRAQRWRTAPSVS